MSFEMECAVSREQQRDERDDLQIAPIFARQDFPGGGGNDEREKVHVYRCGRQPSDVGGNRHDDPSGNPDQNEREQRFALNWKLTCPVRDGSEKESGDHRRQIAPYSISWTCQSRGANAECSDSSP